MKIILRELELKDEKSFIQAIIEFQQIQPVWDFAFEYNDSIPFSMYVQRLHNWSLGLDLPADWVRNTFLVALNKETIIGRVSIRHRLNKHLEMYDGHIGYGGVPSYRGQGYAKEILRLALLEAKKLKIQRVLVSADENNVASTRVIERNGGIYDNSVTQPDCRIPKRRYWINLA